MTLEEFLNKQPKENIRFALSESWKDGDGKPLQWEMRTLSQQEGKELRQRLVGRKLDKIDALFEFAAESLTDPDLHRKEFLDGASAKAGKPILTPADALRVMLDNDEVQRLAAIYAEYSGMNQSVGALVEQAKN